MNSKLKLDLACLQHDCESPLKNGDEALIAIAHAVDNIGAAFGNDAAEPERGAVMYNLSLLADSAARIATALEAISAATSTQPTAGKGCQCHE